MTLRDRAKQYYEAKGKGVLERYLPLLSKCFSVFARFLSPLTPVLDLFLGRVRETKGSNKIPYELRCSLADKSRLYLRLSAAHTDKNGFIMTDECDSLLFSALYGVGGGSVHIEAARDGNGQWHRRPSKDCYPKYSKSTISNDMLLGAMVYLFWLAKREPERAAQMAKDLYRYGREHCWVMGQGDPARTYMRPGLQATLAELVHKLDGHDDELTRNLPQLWSVGTDFETHLAVLHIYLRGCLKGYITRPMLRVLREAVENNSRNAFFWYVLRKYDGKDQESALRILSDPLLFPDDRLPSNHERRAPYLWQRSCNSVNWLPEKASPRIEHSGADFLLVATLLLTE